MPTARTSVQSNRDVQAGRRWRLAVVLLAVLAVGQSTGASAVAEQVVAEQVSAGEEPGPDPIGLWQYGTWFNPETNAWEEPDEYTQGVGFEFVSGPEPMLYTGSFVLLDPLAAGDCTVVGFAFESEIDPGDPRLVSPPGTSPVVAWEGTATDICGGEPERVVDIQAALLDDGRLLIGWSTFVRAECSATTGGFTAARGFRVGLVDAPVCGADCSRVEGSVVRIVHGPQWITPHILVPIPSGWTVDLSRSNGLDCVWGKRSGVVTISFQPRPSYSGEEYFATGYNEVRVTLEWTMNPDHSVSAIDCTDSSPAEDALCTEGDAGLPGGIVAWTENYRLCLPDAAIAVVDLYAEGVAVYDHPDNPTRLVVRGVALYGAGPNRPLADFCADGKALNPSQTALAEEFRGGLVDILGGAVLEEADPPERPSPDQGCAGVDGDVVRIHDIGGGDVRDVQAVDLLVPIPAGWDLTAWEVGCRNPDELEFTRAPDLAITVRLGPPTFEVAGWDDGAECPIPDGPTFECTAANDTLPHDGNISIEQVANYCGRSVDDVVIRQGLSDVDIRARGRVVLDHLFDESMRVVSASTHLEFGPYGCDGNPAEAAVHSEDTVAAISHILAGATLVEHAD